MKKQTAVEWLEDVLNKRLQHLSSNKIHIKEFVRTAKCAEVRKVLEIIKQAKAMEKEQIIDAILQSVVMKDKEKWANLFKEQAEQYYNETFNKLE